MRAACEGYLMDARFSAAIAGDFLTPEQTYNDVVVSIDARFRGNRRSGRIPALRR